MQNWFKDPREWFLALQLLPQTLESLELESLESHLAFMNFRPNSDPSEPEYVETVYPRGASRFIDIEKLFPRLHTLVLLSTASEGGMDGFLPSDLAALPSTLTRFCSIPLSIYNESKLMQVLPRSLQDLDVPLTLPTTPNDELKADWAQSPPELTTMSYIGWPGTMKDMSWLPQSLTDCDLTGSFELNLKTARDLPSGFLSLRLRHSDFAAFAKVESPSENWVACLPRGLTSLEMTSNFAQIIKASDLPFLPRNLSSIFVNNIMQYSIDLPSLRSAFSSSMEGAEASSMAFASASTLLWSATPRLTFLAIPFHSISVEDIKIFPRTLKYLCVCLENRARTIIDSNDLPPSLTTLDLRGESSISLSHELPSMVTSFFALTIRLEKFGLDVDSVAKLPSTLLVLKANLVGSHTVFRQSGIRYTFPPSLTKLELRQWFSEWATFVPRTVTAMDLFLFQVLKPDGEKMAERDLFCDFPPNLTRLSISEMTRYGSQFGPNKEANKLSPTSFASLPRLRFLRVPAGASFPSATLRSLSRVLTEIAATFQSIDEVDAPFFPPSLTSINLNCPPIDTEASWVVNNWPKGALKSLERHGSPKDHFIVQKL